MKTFNLKSFLLMIAVLFSFLYFHIPTDYSQATASACPWPVFTPINITSNNLLINPGFEEGPQENPIGWTGYHYGYTIDPDGGRDGGRALQLTNTEGNTHGAFQIVHLNQTEPQPLYFSGWSKADNITGFSDSDYSLYIDVLYSDGNSLWGQVLLFDTSSQDWQFREGVIIPKKPIESVNFYCLLRASHSGTAWFDDVKVQTIESGIILDSVPIEANPPSPAVYGSESLSLETTDGLSLNLSTEGGAILGIKLNDTQIGDPNFSFASGFFIKDAANNSSFIHVGGSLEQDTEKITHNGIIPELNMEFRAIYRAASDHINIHAEMTNTSNSEEALTLYFALPINATEDWQWGDDIRRNRSISSTNEFINASTEYSGIGASGILSKYPWACLSGPAGGIAMGIPLDKPSIMRLIYNPAVHQFYAAFDLGLSSNTTKFPNRAWADLIIYPFDGEWGFRAAAKGYYERFPDAFIRRIPPNREGIWVAFTDLSSINNVEDFTIAFHETGNLDLVPFDQDNGILPFYYLSEPQTHWLSVNDSTVNLDDYDQVIAHLQGQYGLPNLLKNDRF
jgi:hypothetical protein